MEVPLSVIVLLSAIVTWVVGLIIPRRSFDLRTSAHTVCVLVSMRASDGVADYVMRILNSAHSPESVRVNVLLECNTPQDAELGYMPSARLRSTCQVKHVRTKSHLSPADRVRRLIRHFPCVDEDLCVILDSRVGLVDGWDTLLEQLFSDAPNGAFVSSPAVRRSTDDVLYPTLCEVENGVSRGLSKPFKAPTSAPSLTPIVCWCSEYLACRPHDLQKFPTCAQSSSEFENILAPSHVIVSSIVPPDVFCAEDVPSSKTTLTKSMKMGLSPSADENEHILKLGSVFKSRMVIH